MDPISCPSPRNWPVGTVYSFCRDRNVDVSTAVNTAWAIVLWSYTGEEIIGFPSQTVKHDAQISSRCESAIESTSTFSNVLQTVQQSTKQLSISTTATNTSSSSSSSSSTHQHTPVLNTVTIFTSNSSCCIAPEGTAHSTGLVCNLSETTLDCSVRLFVPGVIDTRQAERLASAFAHVMDLLLTGTEETLASMDLVSDHDKAQVCRVPFPFPFFSSPC
jgi:hypothetical protein